MFGSTLRLPSGVFRMIFDPRFQYLLGIDVFLVGESVMILCGDFSLTTGDMHSVGEHGGGADLCPPRKLSGKIGHESFGKIFHLKNNHHK